VSTVFDTVTAAAEECSIMSCVNSWKRFSGGWLQVNSLQSLAVATDLRVMDWAGYSWKIYSRHFSVNVIFLLS